MDFALQGIPGPSGLFLNAKCGTKTTPFWILHRILAHDLITEQPRCYPDGFFFSFFIKIKVNTFLVENDNSKVNKQFPGVYRVAYNGFANV